MSTWLQRVFNVRREELVPVVLAAAFFFCILTALMMMRPARDALGMQRGIEAVRWLFIGTALATLAVNPLFGWLVSRFRRLQFITATYVFFSLSLLAFYLLLELAPEAIGITSGQVFYVWFSVFNLFVTMVFWALMADRFTLEQARRVFALIAVGGTLGAIAGPALAALLARPLGTPALLLVAVGFLLLGVVMAWLLAMLVVFEATFRAIQRAITRPARETLYTVVSREDKYKSKAFIDTFVYRSGDVVGAQVEGGLGRLGMGLGTLAAVAVPLALVWALLGLWLGRTQQRLAAAGIIETTVATAPPHPPEARSPS